MSVTKRCLSDKIFRTIGVVVMSFFSFIFVFLLVWMFLSSFRTAPSYSMNSFKLFDKYTIDNYLRLFSVTVDTTTRSVGLIHMILNTFVVTTGTIIIAVTIPALTGYVVAKYNFFVKRVMDILALATMIIPTIGNTVVLYQLMFKMRLINTYFAIFLLNAGGFGMTYLLFRNFYAAIPTDYLEAGFLDGASNMQVFFKIMFPQSLPLVISVAIMAFIGSWNDFNTPYIYMEENPTVAVGINILYQKYAVLKNDFPVAFAAMSFSSLVSLILYASFSKTIMQSMSVGGLKG